LSRKIDDRGIGTDDDSTVGPRVVVWAAPSIHTSYLAKPEPLSDEPFHEKVGVSVLTQASASGASSVNAAGGVTSTRALQVDVDWVVPPVPSRATTNQLWKLSVRASLGNSVYEGVPTEMASFFKTPST
jgi:hypothetical protein